jgi:hypothetical protein
MSTPRYTEEQVRAIFERAAVRQEAARRAGAAGPDGLTLEELQQIGTASGIDPAHVAAAAYEVLAEAPERETLLGMPVAIRRTRHLPGPVTDAVWEQMVAALRRQFDNAGIAGEVGRQREWTTAPSGMKHSAPVRVEVVPEGDGCRVTIEQTLRRTALPFTIVAGAYSAVALLFGVLLAAGALGSDGAFMPALFAAMALLMFGGAQVGFRLYARRQEARFEAALDRLELVAREAAPAGGVRGAPTPALTEPGRPALDLDALPEEPEAEPARRAPWRTRS